MRFRFESATADCLPIYSLYRESLPLEHPHRVRGLMNGTTTVILETIEAGGTFDDGVRAAQDAGIAEADPSLDVDGFDAAVKVVAIANVLMDGDLRVTDIDITGIRELDFAEVRAAKHAGTPIRLVATVEKVDGVVRGSRRADAARAGRPVPVDGRDGPRRPLRGRPPARPDRRRPRPDTEVHGVRRPGGHHLGPARPLTHLPAAAATVRDVW